MGNRIRLILATSCLFILFFVIMTNAFSQEKTRIKKGDDFPLIPLGTPVDSNHLAYLGISKGDSFTIRDIKADLVLVEIMNINCSSCQKQAPINNKLYSLIESTPGTRGRVKMIAIAAGGLNEHIKQFTDHFKTPYPVLQDPKFNVYDAVGGGSIPLALFVRQAPGGDASIVAGTHLGFDLDYEGIFKEIQKLMVVNLATTREEGKKIKAKVMYAKPILSEKALQAKVKKAFEKEGDKVGEIKKIALSSDLPIYTSTVEKDGHRKSLFAVMASSPPPCDVCHDVHFIYLFEQTGKILQLIPIQLTKEDNEDWDETDLEKMREKVVGRHINMPFDFDPDVDAVTSATITSSMIFKSLDDGQNLFRELKEKGLL